MGFLASVGLLHMLWRRYFADVSAWVVATCTLALGLATGVPVMLPRSAYNEVAISCGYMLMMLTLCCDMVCGYTSRNGDGAGCRRRVWRTGWQWERIALLFGAVNLLVTVAQAWRERRRVWTLLIAAIAPITLIGLGLMLYNAMRFDSPFEFGQHYQLAAVRPIGRQFFRLALPLVQSPRLFSTGTLERSFPIHTGNQRTTIPGR